MESIEEEEEEEQSVSLNDEVENLSDSSKLSVKLERQKTMIEEKLKFYHIECNRYNTQRVKIVENCIRDESEICNLDDYMITTLGCKIAFDSFQKFPITPLREISLKDNHLECDCCNAISDFIQSSATLEILNLEGTNKWYLISQKKITSFLVENFQFFSKRAKFTFSQGINLRFSSNLAVTKKFENFSTKMLRVFSESLHLIN